LLEVEPAGIVADGGVAVGLEPIDVGAGAGIGELTDVGELSLLTKGSA
jgi:hypothetical protein